MKLAFTWKLPMKSKWRMLLISNILEMMEEGKTFGKPTNMLVGVLS